MDTVRILHCADLHLGAGGTSRHGSPGERKRERLASFSKIAGLCSERAIDIVLIAGDLFDSSAVDPDLLRAVKEYLSACPSRVFIAPGNHDYIALDSPYLDNDWPDHVSVFQGGLEAIDLPDLPVTVWGAGFTSSYITDPLTFQTRSPDPSRIHLCVVHGDLISEGGESLYRPVTRSAIAGSGMDYVALGHIHQRSAKIEKERDTCFAYSGCHDGGGFDELGPKGVWVGTVGKGKVKLEFLPLSSRMYLIEDVDVTDVETEASASRLIEEKLRQDVGETWKQHFYRIRLIGQFPSDKAYFWPNVQAALSEQAHAIRLIDETDPVEDYGTLAKEITLKGIFVRRMMEKMKGTLTDDERREMELALKYGIRAFTGQVTPRDY